MHLKTTIFITCALALNLACASSRNTTDFEMAVGETSLKIAVSQDLVVDLLEKGLGTRIECSGSVDSDLRKLLEPLEGHRWASSSVGEGGERVTAKRRWNSLLLRAGDPRKGHLEATVPWALADCLLGRDIDLDDVFGRGKISVSLTTENGEVIRARLR